MHGVLNLAIIIITIYQFYLHTVGKVAYSTKTERERERYKGVETQGKRQWGRDISRRRDMGGATTGMRQRGTNRGNETRVIAKKEGDREGETEVETQRDRSRKGKNRGE